MSQPPHSGILLPYQQRWILDPSAVKVCEKSRQIGITWTTAFDAVVDAASRGGSDWWYTGYNKDQAAEFILDVKWWVETLGKSASMGQEIMDDEGKQILVHTARFNSGHRITALPSIPRALRGKRGVIVADEFAFHENPQEILKAALAVLMWGGRVQIISTHNGLDSPFNRLIEEVRSGKRSYNVHSVTLDDAIGEGLYRKICETRGVAWGENDQGSWRQEIVESYGDAAEEELFCVPSGSGGAYLSRQVIEDCMVVAPVVRLSLPDDFVQQTESERRDHVEAWVSTHLDMPLKRLDASRVTAIGMDFGRSSDISVIVPLVLEQDMVRSCPFVVEMRNVPFRQQEQVLFYVCDKLPRFTAGKIDAGGNGQYIAEAASLRYGQGRMEEVHLSDRRYSELLPPLRAAFEDRTIRIPRDADILSDLRQFQMINGVPKLPKHRQTSRIDHKPRHGDAGVAFALAYDASRAEVPEIAYEPVRPRGMWAGRRGAL